MIKIEEIPLNLRDNRTAIKYHAYCLTCNDPTDTVLQLIEGVSKVEALQFARSHEQEQGLGHSILVDYSFSEIPAQDFQLYATKTK